MQLCRGQDKHEVLWRLFQNLQQSLLHTFTRHDARKRRIVALAGAPQAPGRAGPVQAAAPRYRLAAGERAVLARLRAMGEDEFAALPYGSEGLWQKVMHACRTEDLKADRRQAAELFRNL